MLNEQQRTQADLTIRERLAGVLKSLDIRVLAAYWPLSGEPDLRPLLVQLHDQGFVIALPRVAQPDAPLQFDRWSPEAALQQGPFGTLHLQAQDPQRPQLLILPCLGFDLQCHRLGYGGGYYDRTLEQLAGVATIGVAYGICEIENFDAQHHDLPLEWIVTEAGLLCRR